MLAVCGVISLLLIYQMLTALLAGPDSSKKLVIMIAALTILAASIIMIPISTGGVRSEPAR